MLTTAALLGVVPVRAGNADGPVQVGSGVHHGPRHAHAHRGGGPGQGHKPVHRRGGAKHHSPGLSSQITLGTAAPKGPILPGRVYGWPFQVSNRGPSGVPGVGFSATMPKSLEFVSAEQYCAFQGNMVICAVGSLKRGEVRSGVIKARVVTSVKPRQAIGGTAAVTWGRAQIRRSFPPVTVADTADISVTKNALSQVRPGQTVSYSITVRNQGPAAAENVQLTDVVRVVKASAPVDVVKMGNGCVQRGIGYVCAIGALAPGQEKSVTVGAKVASSATPGAVIRAPSKVSTSTAEWNLTNNQASTSTKVISAAYHGAVVHQVPAVGGAGGTTGGGELPRTGEDSGNTVTLAFWLLGAGLILVRLGRPRRRPALYAEPLSGDVVVIGSWPERR